ncbi:MAG: hypothetical protein JRJ31_21675 [Deltaproteobacteria bacterium]|nr:hypothetical protein [Deltaproteobacteria bacterium]
MVGTTESFSIGHSSFVTGMGQYYRNPNGYVRHAYLKDTVNYESAPPEQVGGTPF